MLVFQGVLFICLFLSGLNWPPPIYLQHSMNVVATVDLLMEDTCTSQRIVYPIFHRALLYIYIGGGFKDFFDFIPT